MATLVELFLPAIDFALGRLLTAGIGYDSREAGYALVGAANSETEVVTALPVVSRIDHRDWSFLDSSWLWEGVVFFDIASRA